MDIDPGFTFHRQTEVFHSSSILFSDLAHGMPLAALEVVLAAPGQGADRAGHVGLGRQGGGLVGGSGRNKDLSVVNRLLKQSRF